MSATVKGGGYNFQTSSVGGTWCWTVRANNTQGLGQLYDVANILTPYGPLENVQIPIPGDVVVSMYESLLDIKGQLAPLLSLVQPATTLYTVTITEGDPDQEVGTVDFQNVGAFGSFMTVTATPGASWLEASPEVTQDLGKNQTGSVNIALLTSTFLQSGSPYSAVVNLQDNRDPPTVIPITVTVVVLPRPVILASPTSVDLTYIIATSTPGPSQTVTVQNSGPSGSVLNWTAAAVNGSAWISLAPSSGGPLASGESDDVIISVVPSQAPSVPGTYTETVRISSGNASNSPVDVSVSLIVT